MRNLEELLAKKKTLKKPKDLDEKTVFFVFLKVIQEFYGTRGEESVRPVRFYQGKLYLKPESSLWANEVFLQKEKLIQNANAILEGNYIEDIVLTQRDFENTKN
jgi:Dna[CI] antecedent, DciA